MYDQLLCFVGRIREHEQFGQELDGDSISTLTGRRVGGECSVSEVIRTLSSSSTVYHCLVDIAAIFRGEVMW